VVGEGDSLQETLDYQSNEKILFKKDTYKYGIQMPKSIREAHELDKKTSTDYWHHAIVKEMIKNASAFKFLELDESVPIGSTWIPCNMIFDVKADLMQKARFAARGHWTDLPSQITY
jgi:hypothetical protein